MIAKTKEVLRKLEFGVLEFFVGALMVIGIVGYFGSVPADFDWIDHTISFILFTYLFYKLNITSILFGKTSKAANLVIVLSYFSLFFKDIISYTSLDAFKFKVITFVDNFYLFFSNNLPLTNLVTFYIGVLGILVISFYLTKKINISHPSLLYALHQKELKNKPVKFIWIFVLLLGFYYFIYNIILEWLEFTLDDPVIATGIVFFIYKISMHRQKFHADNFVFKIGDFSSKLYSKFVSLFHYKKTLPLAISGLLILHALSDLGVFAYSLVFSKENFYLGLLRYEHVPFLKLFLEDAKSMPSFAIVPLFIAYLLNALSLMIFLLIPVVVWVSLFSRKGFHINNAFLFFIYSSVVAYILLPGYIIQPITELSIRGAVIGENEAVGGIDVLSLPLLESKSILDDFFPNKSTVIVAVSIVAILFGLIVYAFSFRPKIKKELYAISIIGGMVFYTIYLYYFFSSLLAYFYDGILATISTLNFLIGMILAIFLILSIMFYIGGYLMFLYEIVMEYHKRKWSEPIDEELVAVIKNMKKFEGRVIKQKKAQFVGEIFKYALVGFVSIAVLFAGYKMINAVKDRACQTELAKFEIELRGLDKGLRFGTKDLQSYDVPCKVDRIYFFDLNKKINPNDFRDAPLIKDSLKSGGSNNVFLVKEGQVKRSFHAGNLEMIYPYHICFIPKFEKISFFVESTGKSAKIISACNQPECTFIPINISEEEAKKVVREAIDFGCASCPKNLDRELENMKLTRQKVEMFRKFTFCEGITNVEILIKPKKGEEVKDFRFYEFIPKSCIDDLNKYLAENIEGNVEIKSDPLILWHFKELSKEQKISYKLNAELDDECSTAIQGLGVAEFIEGGKLAETARQQEEEEEKQEGQQANTPPKISNPPDVSLSGIGLKRRVIRNLWRFAEDKETNPRNLAYTIIDQTNSDLVSCSISIEKHVDCLVKKDGNGVSKVTAQVDDLEFRESASFDVKVNQLCKTHARKACAGNSVYWFDSCNKQETIYKACGANEVCGLGDCRELSSAIRKCTSNKDCQRWYQVCRNSKCCFVMNIFC
ncbi:hypothetical protein HYX02_05400 [Candidatus Woesearchaeota archaeon]|nr:hypothetical protein [Candidatus Woesearchaeota archaeon]